MRGWHRWSTKTLNIQQLEKPKTPFILSKYDKSHGPYLVPKSEAKNQYLGPNLLALIANQYITIHISPKGDLLIPPLVR